MRFTIILIIISSIIFFSSVIYCKKNEYQKDSRIKEKNRKTKKNLINIWGIKEIKNSVLSCSNRHSIIVELGNIDYNLLNENEQKSIDLILTNISKTFKYSSQFFSTTQKVDTTAVIESMYRNIEIHRNDKIKKYGQKIIEYLEEFMNEKDLYVRKNYLIITSSGEREKVERELKNYYDGLKFNLLNIKVQSKLLSEEEIVELLHQELNKNTNDIINEIIRNGGLELYVTAQKER